MSEWHPSVSAKLTEIKSKYNAKDIEFILLSAYDELVAVDWKTFGVFASTATVVELVELSILKWATIVEIIEELPNTDVYDGADETCALCNKFLGEECTGCPVKSRTGQPFCKDSPYRVYAARTTTGHGKLAAAKDEVLFLLDVLKEVEEEREEQHAKED